MSFALRQPPAQTGLDDGLRAALKAWVATWPIWVGASLLLGALGATTTWLFLVVVESDPVLIGFRDIVVGQRIQPGDVPRVSGEELLAAVGRLIPALAVIGIISSILTFSVQAVFYALGVGMLPGRRPTRDGFWRRTATAFVATYAVALATFGLFAIFLWVSFLLGPRFLPITIVCFILGFVAFVWLTLRLWYVIYAAFDGRGITDSIRESWRISRGGVWRSFGWLLLLGVIGVAIGWLIRTAVDAIGQPVIGSFVSITLTSAWSVVGIFLLAILYESQRQRHDAGATPQTAAAEQDPHLLDSRPDDPSSEPM